MNAFEDLSLFFNQGGMRETMRTGIYPHSIEIHSKKLDKTWKFEGIQRSKKGVLKHEGNVLFTFQYKASTNECLVWDKDGNPVEISINGVFSD